MVAKTNAARGGIVACEVPITVVVRTGGMESFDALENQFDGSGNACGTKHLYHFFV